MEVKNILVPVDFSACSKNALKIAIQLARKCGAKIHLVNAVHIHAPHPDYSGGVILDSILTDYEAQVQQSFDELESEIVELKDIPHESDKFVAYLTDAIQAMATSRNIDLVVMGTRQDHSQLDHLEGTHASDVIEISDVPVLVIPESVSVFEPKTIAFASDFVKITGYGSVGILVWLARLFQSEILVFHIASDISEMDMLQDMHMEEIQEILRDIPSSVRTLEFDSIEKGISHFLETHPVDLLAMLARRHNLFARLFKKSHTKAIAIDSKIPLLTFHEM